jgi:hypothetical protein
MGLDGRPCFQPYHKEYIMNKKQTANLKACQDQIEKDLPILLTLFSKVDKTHIMDLGGHISCHSKTLNKPITIQYSLQLQKNDRKTPAATIHIMKQEYYCFWVSHRYPLKNVDMYCLVCPGDNIRIFVYKKDLHTGMNYFKAIAKNTIFSDGVEIWDIAGLKNETINVQQKDIDKFKKKDWVDQKWMRNTSQSLWLIKTYKGIPQEFYTKHSLTQLYNDNLHLKFIYKNFRTASLTINRNSKNGKWSKIAEGSTPDVEYWSIKGDLNAGDNELQASFTK